MMSVANSLWPTTFQIEEVPEPVEILREQADALKEITKGLLYGEVVKSRFLSGNDVYYNFFVNIEGKAYRHKLFSVSYPYLFAYPITIRNYEAGTTTQVEDASAYIEQIRQLLGSDETKRVIGRMLEIAK